MLIHFQNCVLFQNLATDQIRAENENNRNCTTSNDIEQWLKTNWMNDVQNDPKTNDQHSTMNLTHIPSQQTMYVLSRPTNYEMTFSK